MQIHEGRINENLVIPSSLNMIKFLLYRCRQVQNLDLIIQSIILLLRKMGNSFEESIPNVQETFLYTPLYVPGQQYQQTTDMRFDIVGTPKMVKSRLTNLELEEYQVRNFESRVQDDASIYDQRQSSYSKNIVVVFFHQLLSPIEKKFKVRTQKMKGRLNQFSGLTYLEGLCLLEAALHGYAQLVFHAKVPFFITSKMIAINDSGYIRVWLNENFALNKANTGSHIQNQNAMINQVFSVILGHIAYEDTSNFSKIIYQINQFQRLIDAKNVISAMLQNCNRKATMQDLIIREKLRKLKSLTSQGADFKNMMLYHSTVGNNKKVPLNNQMFSSERIYRPSLLRPNSHINPEQDQFARVKLRNQGMRPLQQRAQPLNNELVYQKMSAQRAQQMRNYNSPLTSNQSLIQSRLQRMKSADSRLGSRSAYEMNPSRNTLYQSTVSKA